MLFVDRVTLLLVDRVALLLLDGVANLGRKKMRKIDRDNEKLPVR